MVLLLCPNSFLVFKKISGKINEALINDRLVQFVNNRALMTELVNKK
jgi:hypothetical protein